MDAQKSRCRRQLVEGEAGVETTLTPAWKLAAADAWLESVRGFVGEGPRVVPLPAQRHSR